MTAYEFIDLLFKVAIVPGVGFLWKMAMDVSTIKTRLDLEFVTRKEYFETGVK